MLSVRRPGPLTTVQDRGRHGYAHLGVSPSGALDQPALDAANALVGNTPELAGLEITLGGCVLAAVEPVTVAVTGAPGPLRIGGVDAALGEAHPVDAGAEIEIGNASRGLRRYLAVAGGIDVAAVLGSRSSDTLSGLGPAALRRGDSLPVGPPLAPTLQELVLKGRSDEVGGEIVLRATAGPRDDWFADLEELVRSAYQVSPLSNRVGARLIGTSLTRSRAGELPSEGVVTGAVQVPADGQPLIFLNDHPTTGGYPVIAVVERADLPLLAQARPGAAIRFRLSQWT
ncbi:biotin-dependent carboxylase-like uncharacterized protein [Allocatelliglobosispora scoriae]|uniref:Biotin-dependent carboxylase-like uncharacterized protein n=1 Tax=Allocatelliglobosispora scoriae TaxID=643052 RepID=A0A841BUI0_9ACTN|nr:biotin-dependent carboxyltransferase family protein [Allocatelliglobosispora scoriae]MBB5871108.1 biotin-dependent carboxylase-like uncharacterized protein [Allocatelliglobosispora scoriae]